MTLFRVLALIAGVTSACDVLPRPGDTQGVQQAARWEQHGRIVVEPDPRYTLVHLRVDTNVAARHDVLLARFDFDPSEGLGDEYALTVALDLGDARPDGLRAGVVVAIVVSLAVGPSGRLAAQTDRQAVRPSDRLTIDTIIIE